LSVSWTKTPRVLDITWFSYARESAGLNRSKGIIWFCSSGVGLANKTGVDSTKNKDSEGSGTTVFPEGFLESILLE
jgi:hypothetical protein